MARKCMLRLMCERRVIAPRRSPRAKAAVTADALDLMRGTEVPRIPAADEGVRWVLTAVGHIDCEVVRSHVCKRGDCFAHYGGTLLCFSQSL